MISFLRGIVFECTEDSVIIDVNGVGYEVMIHQRAFARLAEPGGEICIFTHLQVLENEFKLYGFLDRKELRLFHTLLQVSGIGAKGALNILAFMEPEVFYRAITSKDEKLLTKIPGVGKKTAQRLIFELKDRIADTMITASDSQADGINDVIEALETLGYNRSEVFPLVMKLNEQGKLSENIEDNLKKVLQYKSAQLKK
ncbi:MAG: Holliday junction branch migration protein RuvA [Syntrophomonadaceae bacterium]|nr:Holliday junction branch migration protein RuvA [Syntrophomonadaceae bacterium]MDD3890212.1 Holliday junction branch migration protein RuvA [Syntrophomonadaceae bacterium]MDD4548660.1 Holliday junction branch migration protein RuvA [Syntrophomonadaceae bacterium]